jgi:hypothetical protein
METISIINKHNLKIKRKLEIFIHHYDFCLRVHVLFKTSVQKKANLK